MAALYTFRTLAGFRALTLAGTAAAVQTGDATRAPSINRARIKVPHPDAERIIRATQADGRGGRPFYVCDFGGEILRVPPTSPTATPPPRTPVTLDVVNVEAVPLGGRAFIPPGDGGAWVDAVLTRTPSLVTAREVFDRGSIGANTALPVARKVSSVPRSAFTGDVAAAIYDGATSSLPGFEQLPAVTYDRTSGGRPVFVGGAAEFTGAAFGTLGDLAGPDDAVILLLAEDNGTPTSGDRFTCVSSAFLE